MVVLRRCRFGRLIKGVLIAYIFLTIYLLGYGNKSSERNSLAEDRYNTINKRIANRSELHKVIQEPGADGLAIDVSKYELNMELTNQIEANKLKHGFNTFVSDIISLRRKLSDLRPDSCKTMIFPSDLPPVSVVILFREEWPSILLRTAYSVLDMTPAHLLKEIILVDDGSESVDLKVKVDVHVKAVDKFKLIRNNVSEGLMMARQKGIEASSADYFVVLDGHIEVGHGWLEPLIYRLVQEPNACLTPAVDRIYPDNFIVQIRPTRIVRMSFPFFDPFTLNQARVPYKSSYINNITIGTQPLYVGMVQGMAIAMRKAFFLQLGGFDPGMHIWGSEQVELSLKVWLCGGRVEVVPCSGVAHMFRSSSWIKPVNNTPHTAINSRRIAEVWLDPPQRDMFLKYMDKFTRNYGDVTDRIKIRDQNKCKSYKYFVDKIHEFSDVFLPISVQNLGTIYNGRADMCIDLAYDPNTYTYNISLYPCHGNSNQMFAFTEECEIRVSDFHYLTATLIKEEWQLKIGWKPLVELMPQMRWSYNSDGTIVNNKTEQCITSVGDRNIALTPCTGHADQVWKWDRHTYRTPTN